MQNINKTALVIGASGFVGKFLISKLLQENFRVFALFRNVEIQGMELRNWLKLQKVEDKQLTCVQGDITLTDLGLSQQDWFNLSYVDFLFNTSALFSWNLSMEDARIVNVKGLKNILKAVNEHCHLKRAIHLSGYMLTLQEHLQESGVNLTDIEQTNWNGVYKNLGAYEASKIEGHFTWIKHAELYEIAWTVIHPATVIGDESSGEIPRNQPVYQLIQQISQGKMLLIPATPRHSLPLVSVNMLISAMINATQDSELINQEILIANPKQIPFQHMVQIIADQVKVKSPKYFISLPLLQFILRWEWLAKKMEMSFESLNFLREEKLNIEPFLARNQKWKIVETDLKNALEHATVWVENHL